MSSTTITRGNSHETFYIAPTLTWAPVAAYTTATQTVNLPGLQTTDIIIAVGYTATQVAGVTIAECDCFTPGVLTAQWLNSTNASVTPLSGVYQFQIVRAEGPLPTTAV